MVSCVLPMLTQEGDLRDHTEFMVLALQLDVAYQESILGFLNAQHWLMR